MADVKWIKITTDMFDNGKIKQIRRMPEGNNIVLIWVMLLTMAGKCNCGGMIILTENIPYTVEMLADELGFDKSVVLLAISILEKFHMIRTDEGCFIIDNWNEYQSADRLEKMREKDRIRKKEERERLKIEEKNVHGLSTDTSTDSLILYSYSNSNNINNYKYFRNNKYEDKCYLDNHKELDEAIESWMDYKDHKKPKSSNHYDSERSIKTLVNKIVRKSIEFGDEAVIDCINDSMMNNYAGLFFDKLYKMPVKSTKGKYDGMKFDFE